MQFAKNADKPSMYANTQGLRKKGKKNGFMKISRIHVYNKIEMQHIDLTMGCLTPEISSTSSEEAICKGKTTIKT